MPCTRRIGVSGQAGWASDWLCIEDRFQTIQDFLIELREDFAVKFVENVDLYTIVHANAESTNKIEERGEVILKQITKETVQVIILQ